MYIYKHHIFIYVVIFLDTMTHTYMNVCLYIHALVHILCTTQTHPSIYTTEHLTMICDEFTQSLLISPIIKLSLLIILQIKHPYFIIQLHFVLTLKVSFFSSTTETKSLIYTTEYSGYFVSTNPTHYNHSLPSEQRKLHDEKKAFQKEVDRNETLRLEALRQREREQAIQVAEEQRRVTQLRLERESQPLFVLQKHLLPGVELTDLGRVSGGSLLQ